MDDIERALQRMEQEIERDPERYTEPVRPLGEILGRIHGLYTDRGDGWVEVNGVGGFIPQPRSDHNHSISIRGSFQAPSHSHSIVSSSGPYAAHYTTTFNEHYST